MSNIPKLRFPEFNGEWEEKRFGDILSLNMVPVPKPDTEYERLGIFCHNKGTFHEHITDPSYIALDTLYKVHKNNFIVNITFAWEHAIAITTQNDEDALVTFRFLMFSFNKGYYHQFFKYAFSKEKFRYDLNVASPGGAGRNRVLNQKQLNNINLIVPSISEQEKIADFLSNVDSIITAETKILKTLQKKKKALMQKLFTQQLRFKSDDGTDFPAWEEKKLGECVKKVCVGFVGVCEQFYTDKSGIPMYRTGNLKNGKVNKLDLKYVTKEFHEKNIKSQLQKYDILIARHGENGQASLYNYDEQANCLNIVIVRPNEELAFHNYLINCINSDFVRKEVSRKTAGSTQSVINTKAIEGLIIPLPCKAEQQKIADCLSSMDSLIQTQQKVVTTWQQRKKALLQQMFI